MHNLRLWEYTNSTLKKRSLDLYDSISSKNLILNGQPTIYLPLRERRNFETEMQKYYSEQMYIFTHQVF